MAIDPWLRPISGGGDRDIRRERAIVLRHQAASMRRAAQHLAEPEATAHIARADEVAAYAAAIDALVREFDARPYEQAVR